MNDSLQQIRAFLGTTPGRWEALVAALPADVLQQAPVPGEWSAMECLGHMLDVEQGVFPARVRAFLAGRDIPAFDPDKEGSDHSTASPADLVATFSRLRAENVELLAGLQPTDMERRAVHSELGPVTLGELLHEWVAHDLNHTMQAERALMQPYIANCGAWRVYFENQLIHPAAE